MFTGQNGIFRRLRNYVEASVASALARLSNCAAPLTHRAPVLLDASLPEGNRNALLEVNNRPIQPQSGMTAPGENGLDNGWDAIFNNAVLFRGWAIGVFKLIKITVEHTFGSDGPSYNSFCQGQLCDLDGTITPGSPTFTIYLPRTTTQDPNVRVGDIIKSSVLPDGRLVACSEVLDGKINDVRTIYVADPTTPLDYTAADGVRGWRVADGTNGTIDMSGRVPYGWTSGGSTVGTAVAAGGTVSAHAAATSDGTTIATASATVASHSFTFTTKLMDDTIAGTATDPALVETVMGSGTSPATITHDAHSHNFTQGDVRSALADHTLSSVTAAGRILLMLQRVS